MYNTPRKMFTPVSGQVYELLTNKGDTFPVLIISASPDSSAATLRLFDTPRRVNNVSVSVDGVDMYADVSKPGYTLFSDLNGKIAELSNDDLSKVRRYMASALNLSGIGSMAVSPASSLSCETEIKRLETALDGANKDIKRLTDSLAAANAELDQLDDAQREIDKLATTLDIYKSLYADLLGKITEK